MPVDTLEQHEHLARSLIDPKAWPAGGGDRRRIDTHISTVVLAGSHAYKLKKPLDLGFLDFVSLEDRHRACCEELRINRRLAPDIYQSVCAVTGTIDRPALDGDGDGDGEVIDWAVKMRRFDPDAVLSNPAVGLNEGVIDELAGEIGRFHEAVERAHPDSGYGTPESVGLPMRQNFEQIREYWPAAESLLADLPEWTDKALKVQQARLSQRVTDGHIRECHGDLHLGNIAMIDQRPVVFDAIEFNASLRWIDTANDVAFLTMDLHQRERADLARRFIDRYLQETGDYAMLPVLTLYEVYRAMVRAKIAAIRVEQTQGDERRQAENLVRCYIELAKRLKLKGAGGLVITHGVSGSGKSHAAAALLKTFPGLLRIRSDVERKRMLGVAPTDEASAEGAYSAKMTQSVYERLLALAGSVMAAGQVAVVDATFLERAWRDRFRELATTSGVPFLVLDCVAPVDTLRARIGRRAGQADNVSDAGVAVLERQLGAVHLLDDDELNDALQVSPDTPLDLDEAKRRLGYSASSPA
jgi:aminoglycoside phosphotransferase family enzyme/predicted kinase